FSTRSETWIGSWIFLPVLLETHPVELAAFEAIHVPLFEIGPRGRGRRCSGFLFRLNQPLAVKAQCSLWRCVGADRCRVRRVDVNFPSAALITAASTALSSATLSPT